MKNVIRISLIFVFLLAQSSCLSSSDVSGSLGSNSGGGGNGGTVTSWAVQFGATASLPGGDASQGDSFSGVAIDGNGNIYISGTTAGALGEANGGGGNPDIFIAKFNSAGVRQWIRQLGATTAVPGGDTTGSDSCNAITVDGSGNVYCAGNTYSSLGEANGGQSDAFVVKLNSSGVIQWIRQLGATTVVPGGDTSTDEMCTSIAVDGSGNVYCAGTTFGSLGEANGGTLDAFVMKLDSTGAVQWIRQLGATTAVAGSTAGWEYCNGVAVDGSGNVYCGGFTTGALGEANGGNYDAFVMKLNSSGVVQWIRQLGATTVVPGGDKSQNDACNSVAVDAGGNVYCGGQTAGALGEANGGASDIFVMKLDSAGALQWIRQLGAVTSVPGGSTAGDEYCNNMTLDSSGNIYCAGITSGALGEANGGSYDAYVLKLDSSGALDWIRQFGAVTKGFASGNNSAYDSFAGVAVGPNGEVCAAGQTNGDFADAQAGGMGNGDGMVVKLKPDGAL